MTNSQQTAYPPYAVIFDMDGVLLDTSKYNMDSFDEILKPHGLSIQLIQDKHGEGFRGTSLQRILTVIKEHYGIDFDVDQFSRQAGEISFDHMDRNGTQGDPFLVNFLKELRDYAIPVGIGTSSFQWRVDPILDRIGAQEFFDVVVTAEDVQKHKPDPEVFLKVARRLKVDPSRCVVIEDARSGIEAAHNGGMKAIAFTAYNGDPQIVIDADFSVKDFSELNREVIERVLNGN